MRLEPDRLRGRSQARHSYLQSIADFAEREIRVIGRRAGFRTAGAHVAIRPGRAWQWHGGSALRRMAGDHLHWDKDGKEQTHRCYSGQGANHQETHHNYTLQPQGSASQPVRSRFMRSSFCVRAAPLALRPSLPQNTVSTRALGVLTVQP